MAQSVKTPILDFGSGHDLMVVRVSPMLGSTVSVEPAWGSFSLPLSLPLPCSHTHSVSLKINKH